MYQKAWFVVPNVVPLYSVAPHCTTL